MENQKNRKRKTAIFLTNAAFLIWKGTPSTSMSIDVSASTVGQKTNVDGFCAAQGEYKHLYLYLYCIDMSMYVFISIFISCVIQYQELVLVATVRPWPLASQRSWHQQPWPRILDTSSAPTLHLTPPVGEKSGEVPSMSRGEHKCRCI